MKTRTALHLLLVTLLCVLVYARTIDAPFEFDDSGVIVNNPIIRDLTLFAHPLDASRYDKDYLEYKTFRSRYAAYLTFALNYRYGGLDVRGYHAVNIAIHIAASLLVYAVALLLFRTPGLAGTSLNARHVALLASALFAGHPLQTEAVTYICQRAASMAAMFYLMSIAFYLMWRLRGGWTVCAGALLAAIAAMKSKETAFTLPFAVLFVELMFFDGRLGARLKRLLPFALLLPLIPLGRADSLADIAGATADQLSSLSRSEYLMTQFSVLLRYLTLAVFPVGQNFDYDFPVARSLSEPRTIASLIALAGMAALGLAAWFRRSKAPGERLAAFGVLWFFLTLSVESSFIPIIDVIFEHRMYLPMASITIGVSAVLVRGADVAKGRARQAMVALLVALPLVYAFAAWQRNAVWKSGIALWGDTVAKSPMKPRARNNLGAAYLNAGQLDSAEREFRAAIDADPKYFSAYFNLAVIYHKSGRLDEAKRYYLETIRLNSNHALAEFNLGVLLMGEGEDNDAIAHLRRAVEIHPYYPAPHMALAGIDERAGRYDEAEREYREAVRLKPESAEFRMGLSVFLINRGRPGDAVRELRALIDMEPGSAGAYTNMGVAYLMLRDYQNARSAFSFAVRLAPDNPEFHYNLGYANQMAGDRDMARREYNEAVRLNPSEPKYPKAIAALK